jgi:hypothetical protein
MMRKSRLTEEQIIAALKEHAAIEAATRQYKAGSAYRRPRRLK